MNPAAWIVSFARPLNPRRIRAHALILAICLWGVWAVDFSTPGLFDRAGNIKFQDFIQFPVSAHLIAEGRSQELYNPQILGDAVHALAGPESQVRLQYFYGPQVALPFVLLLPLPFLAQAEVWVAFSLFLYLCCIYLVWKTCSALRPYLGLVVLCAIGYPPVFHFFVRGQISSAMLVCFTAAWLAFRAKRDWLAGLFLGFLFVKPQFLIAVSLVLLLARSWQALAALVLSAAAQLALTFTYFGRSVMRAYFQMLLHSASQPGTTELSFSPLQMHSLRSFWELLVPSPAFVWVLYALTSIAVIALAADTWRSSSPLAIRYASLVLAAVLVNPHLYIYDLLVLAPALLLVSDWALGNSQQPSTPAIQVLLYLSFTLPLIGPLSRWTHVQVSVLAFTALLCLLWRISRNSAESPQEELAPSESAVV